MRPNVEGLDAQCTSFRVLGKTFSPYAMAYENGKVIVLCNGLKPPLAQQWPLYKHFE
ncbi:MAG: hypothetical protein JO036_19460 [Candidatus Eremiobacteraeota bacterium]|nr:hypothetical protein [Candidatus Eremiobacteraeota bacterium]